MSINSLAIPADMRNEKDVKNLISKII